MSDWRLRLYHSAPPSIRSVIASIRGYQLKSWRYGSDTEDLVEQALERDYWSPQQWQTYCENRLSHLLNRALKQVPYYREQWAQRRRQGDKASPEYLENWPVLNKNVVRQNAMAFIADDCDARQMYHEHTSGTTGTSLSIWWSKKLVREWYALFEARWRRWHGVNRHNRWAILGGQLVTSSKQQKPPFWVWNRAFKQLYMSTYHISPKSISYYLEALDRFEVEYVYCYTSAAYLLASLAREQNHNARQMKVVITNAEPLLSYQRDLIRDVFNCPVRETYGMSEIVVAAGECDNGSLHAWPEVGILEVMQDTGITQDGDVGEFIATGLMNKDMPLIRYRVGDRGSLAGNLVGCNCGRSLPILKQIEGRTDDVLYTRDGRMIGRLDPVFKSDLPVREAQIIQENLDLIRVRFVASDGFSESATDSIAARLRDRLGDIEVRFERVNEIPRTNNGKFRSVISNLSPEDRGRLS